MNHIPSIKDIDVKGKKALVRADLNVPMAHGKISDHTRINRVLPTIRELMKRGAKVIILSHFGRPDGVYDPSFSLAPITDALAKALGVDVKFGVDCVGHAAEEAVANLKAGEAILLENLRFHAGEEENSADFADQLATLGDIYVNDAFSCSHRAHASIVGLAERLPSVAGFLLQEELENLENLLSHPKKPYAGIVGGSKISSKLELLDALVNSVDLLAIGGGMANTFLAAKKFNIGTSSYEKNLLATAEKILKKAEKNGCEILLPSDVVVAADLDYSPECEVVAAEKIPADKMALDIGPETVKAITEKLRGCKTVIWNGPLGAFEYPPFDVGTISVARAIAGLTKASGLVSVAGGGDVLAAIAKAGLSNQFTYVSTAGGAFLEWLEGKELPGITALHQQNLKQAKA